jgi:hypothetical protein
MIVVFVMAGAGVVVDADDIAISVFGRLFINYNF